ncbi:hypothetical protein [Burkholderia cepacia]|uniref:hypothetical protein n=1 Tax=Burkholderia cepacia TaxID=292 RepID=UPI002AB696F1|nr:hypothetical protein [Burkholderia cepacia]
MTIDKKPGDAPTEWTDDDSESLRLVIDGLARIESGMTEATDDRLLADPPLRKMTFRDAREIASIYLPVLRQLHHKLDGLSVADIGVEKLSTEPAVELSAVKEVLASGDGFWRTCAGCHETVDGHPVGEYPYSEILQCDLGAGCGDCGGIGAVWDNTDYEAMGKAFERAGLLSGEDAAAQPEVASTTTHATKWAPCPVARRALSSSIEVVEALSDSEDRDLSVSETESMMLVLHELKRLQAIEQEAVEIVTRGAIEQSAAAPIDGMPSPVWWINHGSHGLITTRSDEAERARGAGAAVYEYKAISASAPSDAWAAMNDVLFDWQIENGITLTAEVLTDLVRRLRPAQVASATETAAEGSTLVPPRWYSRDEVVHMLKRMNYCDEIALELADWVLRHLQLAFNKGFEKGVRAHVCPVLPGALDIRQRPVSSGGQ